MTMNPRRNRERLLKRRVAVRQPRKTILIFCEGERTEPEYLNALKRQQWVSDVAEVDLRVETKQGGSVPATLVSLAVEARKKDCKGQREFDEFWCVFDVEWPQNHPKLTSVIEEARQGGIKLAVSNPCFELWLILHFQDQNSWLDNDSRASSARTSINPMAKESMRTFTYRSLATL